MLTELLFVLAFPMPADVAETALDDSPVFNTEAWSYSREKVSDGKTFLERHVPAGDPEEHWQLVSVDGREPTKGQLEDFREKVQEEHVEQVEKQRGAGEGTSLLDDVKRDSLVFREETAESWVFSFTPKSETDDERLTSHLEGSLYIDKQSGFVRRLVVQSPAAFKPRFGVTIREFLIDSSFELHPAGELVYSSTHKKIRGSLLVVGSFDQDEQSRYRDYEKVER